MAGCHTERWDGLQRITTFQIFCASKRNMYFQSSIFQPSLLRFTKQIKQWNILIFNFCFWYYTMFLYMLQYIIYDPKWLCSAPLYVGIVSWMPGWSTLCPAALLLARGSTLSSVQSPPTTYTPGHAAHQSILSWIHNTWKSHLKYILSHNITLLLTGV